MSEFAGVLFDMDGVLIDTHNAIVGLWQAVAAEHGVGLTDDDVRRHVTGCAPEHTIAAVFAAVSEPRRQRILDVVRAAEPDLEFEELPGAADLISELHQAGVPLALVTGGSRARCDRVLEKLGLADVFDAVVAWGDVDAGKPAPDCYELAARRLGLPPGSCLAFEDAAGGVRSAVGAGVVCVGVSKNRAALMACGAQEVVDDLSQVRCHRDGRVELFHDGVAVTGFAFPVTGERSHRARNVW